MSDLGQKLIADLRKIVAENPEYIDNTGCYLNPDGSGGCGIGRVLVKNEIINIDFLEKRPIDDEENSQSEFPNSHTFDEVFIEHYVPELKQIDVDEAKWLRYFQEAQDGLANILTKGKKDSRWISSLSYADENVPTIAARFK